MMENTSLPDALVSGKVPHIMEQIILSMITQHMQENQRGGPGPVSMGS